VSWVTPTALDPHVALRKAMPMVEPSRSTLLQRKARGQEYISMSVCASISMSVLCFELCLTRDHPQRTLYVII
jgi:hypothetical protein